MKFGVRCHIVYLRSAQTQLRRRGLFHGESHWAAFYVRSVQLHLELHTVRDKNRLNCYSCKSGHFAHYYSCRAPLLLTQRIQSAVLLAILVCQVQLLLTVKCSFRFGDNVIIALFAFQFTDSGTCAPLVIVVATIFISARVATPGAFFTVHITCKKIALVIRLFSTYPTL